MRIKPLVGFVVIAFAAHAFGAEPPAHRLLSLAEVPLAKCIPKEALGRTAIESKRRDAAAAPRTLHLIDQMSKLVNQLPKSQRPVSELMNSAQSTEFTQISSQLLIHQLNSLAESRLQRDVRVIGFGIEALEKAAAGNKKSSSTNDPKGDGAALIGLLRDELKKDNDYGTDPADKNTCSLDLAMWLKEKVHLDAMRRMLASSEFAQWSALRAKYTITGTVESAALPSPEKEKAQWLFKAVTQPLAREVMAATD